MSWQQLRLVAAPSQSEWLSEWLFTVGALTVTLQDAADQPIFEPELDTTPLWNLTQIIGLFAADFDLTPLLEFLKTAQISNELVSYQVETLEDKNWLQESLRDWQAHRFGSRLWVCPSWQTVVAPEAIIITLDPGLAFGTGTHPTTALCLEWLDAHLISGQTLIDYGCGSGILAIAAKKLGARKVWAIDHDPQALQATDENAHRNQIRATDFIIASPTTLPFCQPDVLIANILAQTLISLAAHFIRLLKPGSTLVLSGILAQQIPDIKAAYGANFTFHTLVIREEWALLAAQSLDLH
ncbi:MAG: 50S ribosomal protein L11 methyltransferase [Gammaproteobacteria bacterium]